MTGPDLPRRTLVVGGAGFIGGHVVTHLLGASTTERVTVYDNFSSGRRWHLAAHEGDDRLVVVEADVKDLERLTGAMDGHDTVVHLASNPDIALAVTEPTIDFWEGTYLTQNVVEAMRRSSARSLLYASGSGVYGDLGDHEFVEDHGPMLPVSTYGASKLAGEALIAAYCAMSGLRANAFRFGNVVGPRQTHGVGFDFLRKLAADPNRLEILGDGQQSKSYIHVDDVIAAVFLANERSTEPFSVFNVATGDYITVTDIARLAIECAGLDPVTVELAYTGGRGGWKGDVPVIRLDTERIRGLGWLCRRSSAEALRASLEAMVVDLRAGRL